MATYLEDDDTFVARIQADEQKKAAALRGTLYEVVDTNPDEFAQTHRTAKALSIPAPALEALPDLAKDAKVQKLAESVAQSPTVHKRMVEDAAFAKLAQDDTDTLGAFEKVFKRIAGIGLINVVSDIAASQNNARSWWDVPTDTAASVASGVNSFAATVLEGSRYAPQQRVADMLLKALAPEAARRQRESLDAMQSGLQSGADFWREAKSEDIKARRAAIDQAPLMQSMGLLVTDPGAMSDMLAESAAYLLPGASLAKAGPTVWVLGNAALEALDSAATTRQEALTNSATLRQQDDAAQLAGAVTFPIALVGNLLPGTHKLESRFFRGDKISESFVSSVLKELVSGAFEEGGNTFGSNVGASVTYDQGRDLTQGVAKSAAIGGLLEATHGAAIKTISQVATQVAPLEEKALQAQQNKAVLAQIDELASVSKTKARAPDVFQQFVESATEDGPVQDVYVDAQVLAQSGIVEQLAQVSPAIAEQYNDAIQTGGSVRVPIAEYVANIAGTEMNQPLIDHLKLDPNGLTFAESEQFQQTYKAEFENQIGQVLTEVQGDEVFNASRDEVNQLFKAQLDAAGYANQNANDTYATIASSYYAVRAAALGVSPKELYDARPLRVTGESLTGDTLNQEGKVLADVQKNWTDKGILSAMSENEDSIDLSRIEVPKEARNTGIGSAAMRELTAYADAVGKRITLTPSADFGGTVSRLKKFYTRFGFVENKGKNKDFTTRARMLREPNILRQTSIGATGNAPEDFITFNGSKNIAQISTDLGEKIKRQAGVIRLNVGENTKDDKGYGKAHIEARHAAQIKGAGFDSVESFVAHILAHTNEIWQANAGQLLLVSRDEQQNVMFLRLQPAVDTDGDYYRINSATPVRRADYADRKGMKLLWKGSEPASIATGEQSEFAAAPDNTSQADPNAYSQSRGIIGRPPVKVNTQGNRGSFSPDTNTISLLKNADLSTFLHELGHAFLAMDINLASQLVNNPQLTEGEQQILNDVSTLLSWFGLQGDARTQLDQWHALSFEEQRAYHEKTAEGFEAYLFDGRAPSLELQPLFQKMRAWFLNVYRNLMAYLQRSGETLTPEVRTVFDRMLASTEEIKLAQQARSMLPLFETATQAGMTPDEFAAYQQIDPQATQDAIAELQARGLRDMQWLGNARAKVLKKLQKEAAQVRREVRMEVAKEILSEPVYQAWTFLTAKQSADDKLAPVARKKSDPNVLDETQDDLFAAIAKLGGVNKDATIAEWGVDSKDNPQSGVFGKPVWRKQGGLSLDHMAELLAEKGYLPVDKHGQYDLRDFEERFNEHMRGAKQVSTAYDYTQDQENLPGAEINANALGAGRLDRVSLAEQYGADSPVLAALTNLRMVSNNGLHQDIVSELFEGFTSGDALIQALLEAQPPRQAIEDATDVRMLERHGDLSTPEALERAVDKAVHNDLRARMIISEHNALAKALGKKAVLAKAAREFAEAMIAKVKVRDLRPSQYSAAEARAAKNAATAFRKTDIETAAADKRNQLVSNYATKAAHNARDEIDSAIRYLRKFSKEGVRKGLDVEYLDQLDALLDRFDLSTGTTLKELDKRDSLLTWVEKQREQGLEPDIPVTLLSEAKRVSYKNMPVEEFRGLVDTVKQIEHLGRLKNRLLTAKDKREYEAVRDIIATSIHENAGNRTADTRTPTTNSGRVWQSLRNFWSSHIKAATMARVLDGGKDGGPMWEYVIRSANEAADFETTERGKATEALSKVMAPVFNLGKMGGKGVYFESIGRSLNREARLAIALNTGNASNLQRLLGGEAWTQAQLQPVLDSLTKAEWDAVQAIWNHFETYRPLIAAKERRVYGKEPLWIEPTPVQTAFGEYRGGYYPVKYDPNASQRAEEHLDAEGAKRQMQGAYTSATTRRSFTKTRVEEVNGRPLLYTLGGVYSGVNEVIHDLAWHEWLIDANRLMRSSTIDSAIRNHYGPEAKRLFKNWISDMAEGDRGADNAGEMALGRLRQGVSIAGLGFNVMSAAIQLTGFSQTIVRIGAKWTGRGVSKYVANPAQATRDVVAASEFMASRFRTQFRELNELRNQVQDQNQAKKAMQDGAYFLLTRVQQMVDVPTWIGAYEKAISEGNVDERAVALADQAVIDSQMSGMTKDLSAIERGGPALKLFTVFYSFMNTTFNLGVMRGMTESNKAKVAADYLLLYVVTPVLGLAIKNAITPGDGEDEWDFEALTKTLLSESLGFLLGQMVVVREFAEAGKTAAGLATNNTGYQGPAGVRVIADTTKFTQQAGQGEFDDAFRKASINLLGSLFGLPAAQINRSISGTNALLEGDTDNPAAVLFGYQSPR